MLQHDDEGLIKSRYTRNARQSLGEHRLVAAWGDGACLYRSLAKVLKKPLGTISGWYLEALENPAELMRFKTRNTVRDVTARKQIEEQLRAIHEFGRSKWLKVRLLSIQLLWMIACSDAG